jgi:hypothetical protein
VDEIVRLCDESTCLVIQMENGPHWCRCWLVSGDGTQKLRLGAESIQNLKSRLLEALTLSPEEFRKQAKQSLHGLLVGVTGLSDPHSLLYVMVGEVDRIFLWIDFPMNVKAISLITPTIRDNWIRQLNDLQV